MRDLAYKIAIALQKKLATKTVGVHIQSLPHVQRAVIGYSLADDRNMVQTAYTESFFEQTDSTHVNWLAKRIYTELTQLLEWANRGNKPKPSAYSEDDEDDRISKAHASQPNKRGRPAKATLPAASQSQDRRSTSNTSERTSSKSHTETDPQSFHAEDVPTGIV